MSPPGAAVASKPACGTTLPPPGSGIYRHQSGVDVRVRIRVKGVIRVLSETHLRATGTIEPSLELPTGVTCTEPTITHSAHTGLP